MPATDVVELKKADLLAAHKAGTPTDKALLVKLYPVVFGDITERVKSFADICEIAGEYEVDYRPTSNMTAKQRKLLFASKLMLIEEVLNEGWIPDYSNADQYKWRPWFEWDNAKSGFGFSGSHYCYSHSATNVGSRFASEKLSDFAGRTFIKEYNDYLTA